MIIAGSVIAAIIIAEVAFAVSAGTEKNATAVQEESAPALPRLQVQGTSLCQDSSDIPVTFKGISFGWHNIWPRFYNAGAVAELHSAWGANIFRASIGADSHAKADNPDCHGGYIDEPDFALECLYNVVDAAIANGCYVIVDWHSHVLHKEAAEDFFTKVATRYADTPNVIYELFNEPVSREFEEAGDYSQPSDESLDSYWCDLKAYAESLISIIDGISTCHPLILMGCPRWDQSIDVAARNPVTCYDNLMYTVHFYAATHGQWLRDRSDAALAQGLPIFISECASCEASGDGPMSPEEWQAWNGWAAERNISMMTWSISDKVETCSMLTKEASSEGPWAGDVIKPWGKIVKDWLK